MQAHVMNGWNVCRLIAAAIAIQSPGWRGTACAAASVAWATGAEFQQRLAQPVDILWSGNPLRPAIQRLSEAQQVAILIDRRVDPGRKLDLTVRGATMDSALQTIADHCGLGVSHLGDVVYLGPPSAAGRLRPAAAAVGQAVRRLPTAVQRKFFQAKPLAWEDLATPRDLLTQLAGQNGLEIAGLEQVPHDLWAAADLPPGSLIDRLSLIAVQFDLTFEVADGGARIRLTPMPDSLSAATDRHDGMPRPSRKPPVPDAAASVEAVRIKHLAIQAQPLGRVLRQLADRLGLELRIDEQSLQAAGISLDRRVSLKVENVTVDELMRQLLQPAGLTFHRRQKVLEIVPAQ